MRKLSGFSLVSELVGGSSWGENPAHSLFFHPLAFFPPSNGGRGGGDAKKHSDSGLSGKTILSEEVRAGKGSEMKSTHLKQFTLT